MANYFGNIHHCQCNRRSAVVRESHCWLVVFNTLIKQFCKNFNKILMYCDGVTFIPSFFLWGGGGGVRGEVALLL